MTKRKKKQTIDSAVSVAGGVIASSTAKQTEAYNVECAQLRTSLSEKAVSNAESLNEKLAVDASYVADRSKGVDLAYQYEQADVAMGGKGSANWTPSEQAELINSGKVRGCEGHHINSVAEVPNQQTNPDNIRFYRGHKEHLVKGHDGNFRKPSSGNLIDKDAMLKATNMRRVVKNEVKGAGITLTIAATTGVATSVLSTCQEEGISFRSIKKGIKRSGKPVLASCTGAIISYTVVRIFEHIFK